MRPTRNLLRLGEYLGLLTTGHGVDCVLRCLPLEMPSGRSRMIGVARVVLLEKPAAFRHLLVHYIAAAGLLRHPPL